MSILKELVGFLKFTGEILYEVFDHPCGSSQPQFGHGYSYDKKSNEQVRDSGQHKSKATVIRARRW